MNRRLPAFFDGRANFDAVFQQQRGITYKYFATFNRRNHAAPTQLRV